MPFLANIPEVEAGRGTVVELCGEEGSGKTEMLLNCVRRCITPKSWKGRLLNGRELAALWIDTDFAFSVLRLVALLEQSLESAPLFPGSSGVQGQQARPNDASRGRTRHDELKAGVDSTISPSSCAHCRQAPYTHSFRDAHRSNEQMPGSKDRLSPSLDAGEPSAKRQFVGLHCKTACSCSDSPNVRNGDTLEPGESPGSVLAERESFVMSCLERLHVLRCESSQQLLTTLHGLPELLRKCGDIALIVLDSVGAFHWIDTSAVNSGGGEHQSDTDVCPAYAGKHVCMPGIYLQYPG